MMLDTIEYAPYSSIHTVAYYIAGSQENLLDSAVEIENKDIMHGELPAEGGVYDSRMGTTNKEWRCGACGQAKPYCPGHCGHIKLRYPVKNSTFRDYIFKFLKVICFRCGRLVVTKTIKCPKHKRLMEYARIVTTDKITKCPYAECEMPHPSIVHDKADPLVVYIEHKGRDEQTHREELFNHIIRDIFSRVTNETLATIGWPTRCHPRNFILDIVRIIPNTARVYIKRQTGTRINSSDDITSLTKQLMEVNINLPLVIPDVADINKNLRDLYGSLDNTYYMMTKNVGSGDLNIVGSYGKPTKSIASRIVHKDGRIRKNLLGKRVHKMTRSVLTCGPSLEVDQVGVPISIASSMVIPEVVRVYNIEYLNTFFLNKKNYPGCTHVWKQSRKAKYDVDKVETLEIGDIIWRHRVNGDVMDINRQPSLTDGNIMAMRMQIIMNGESLRINESACNPLNADFDGDAVNGLICQNVQSRIESSQLSALKKKMISIQKHAPNFGCFQDSLIGSAEITRSHIRINKWQAMLLFGNVLLHNNANINFSKPTYTGRELIGLFMPKINYPKKSAQIYNPDYAPFIKYDPDEITVEFNRGELVSGVLDKKSVGQNKSGTIFHIINNEYGARRALNTLHNFHQIIMNFYLWKGATVGIKDVVLPDSAIAILHEQTRQIIGKAEEITERAHRRELIAPIGTPITKFYESEIMNALSIGDEYIHPIYSNIDTEEGLMRFVMTGSKGDPKNAMAIYGAIGQMTIGMNRMTKNVGGRTSPYYLRGDQHPRANGFIDNSYREGIASDIFSFTAAEARYNEIMKALSTSVAGAQGRICIRNVESILVGNLYNSVKKDNIVQLLYAETGINPTKVEQVKFLTVLISDKKLEEDYRARTNMFDKIYNNKKVEAALAEEYECICNDREEYRNIAFRLHDGNIGKNGLVSNERLMPINPYRIIEDILYTYKDEIEKQTANERRLDPVDAIKEVKKLCEDIAYCYFNKTYESEGRRVPDYITQALTLIRILIRTYLCTANLCRKKVNNKLLRIIIKKIKKIFKSSLISYGLAVGVLAAQCISEPQTQYVIDSKLRGGGGGGTKTSSIDRIKEILGAKGTAEMKNTSMTIMLRRPHGQTKSAVQDVANNIEMMNLDRFVEDGQIFFEKYGEPIHPQYAHETKMIRDFEKYNGGDIPVNLSKWCVRFEINKEELFINGMKLATIIFNMQLSYPNVHFVHTPENADTIIIRCYLQNNAIKATPDKFSEQLVIDFMHTMLDTTIRGIRGIIYTEVVEIPVSQKQEDGSVADVLEWAIITNGTNLEDVLEHPMVDKYRTTTDSIEEMYNMYGIECARLKIINEIQKTMSTNDAATEHTMLIADEMCSSGYITSIQKTGLQSRDAGNVGLQLAFQAPIQVIEKSAVNGIVEEVSGISANFIQGQTPPIGTAYNDVLVNEAWVEDWYKKNSDNLTSVFA